MDALSNKELTTLLEIISDCITCDSIETFFTIISKVENLLQYGHIVFLSSQKDFPSSLPSIQEINVSYPIEWTNIYRTQNYTAVDPIISSGETGLLFWKDIYDRTPPDQDFYSQAQSFGLTNGFSHIISTPKIFGLMSVAGNELVDSSRSRTIINYLAPHFHQLVQHLIKKQARESMPKITPREREVLIWAMEGKSNWEISVILGISQESIKGHISKILNKLDASNRAHAVAIAMQANLLFPYG
ncbi:HTH domain-containing DNA-binding protein [Desulfocapsa sulfexigens DSM 10523]|uniref:HTH domain-containing DNA-binding protein n=1 Tax=Desulfocapsa sulfexigens (strain DSM 10523 / SB164P1) TaxID=1167006 RepID=M1PD01_DESSD|nr:LuxR family transcriptional regulator [Desulfocapsa sulfexigens]AGF77635.1 HTH domain-containing DNA-binding protein [Desulfocapsa sulfexigens DSM 10523]